MSPIPNLLIGMGVMLIIGGILWQVGGRFLHLGKLPGDIVIKKENFSFYFPVVTCIVISIVLSLVMYILRFFNR